MTEKAVEQKPADKLDGMKIEEDVPANDVHAGTGSPPGANVPAIDAPNKLQQLNTGFDGIGDSTFAARVVLDGNQILYKDRDETVDKIEVQLTGGRKVHQYFDEAANSYHKSYDGKFTEDGEPISKFPGMRHMFELDWNELIDGEAKAHQMVLSPTGRYSFVEYAEKLAKLTPPKSVGTVTTIITASRQQNKDGQRYSKPEFTCAELVTKSK
jgi:hypothetical protein